MKKPLNVPILVGIIIAAFGVGMWMAFALNARTNYAPSEAAPSATEAPKRKAATVAFVPAATSPVPTPAPTAQHYWYLTKVSGWGGNYGATNYIGVASRLYPSLSDCESTKIRWAREARHAYAGMKGLLAEKQVEDAYNCVEDTSPVWKGLRPEKRWFLFAGVEPEAYAFTKPKGRTRCTVNLAITSSRYMSGFNFETLQGCSKNFPLWTRSDKEAQSSWQGMAGSGFWARTDKKEGAEAYEQGYACLACVRGDAAILQRGANLSDPEGGGDGKN